MTERNWIAEDFGLPMLTEWTEQRFPLPQFQQLGLMELAVLRHHRPGVYIIEKMSLGRSEYTVRVGSVTTGTIYQRLREHGHDRQITNHASGPSLGGLPSLDSLRAFWTWTEDVVPEGVEKYLEGVLNPREGERYPKTVAEVPIELPQPIRDRILGIVREPLGLPSLA